MTENHGSVSAIPEMLRRRRWMVAGTLAFAMLLPSNALAMNTTPRQAFDQASHALPLPPVRYLDSMRWMDWKPGAPIFKVDTLLLPNGIQPGIFRLPSDDGQDLPRVS
ncbi:hypothetical protein [Bradyrhizobium roseum]|uniref:hypothetical protein n=1 Tax=Bradyrhizobium roseum TaxID=3056648 RepID=UPI0026185262|nr:hypothetical protein [Bradyrhizobium roseus]WKA26085.1 hypothetical protein QUH67_20955 [Bradyrhizobium roseus]